MALFPFVCCFCFVRAFSFQGHTKIAENEPDSRDTAPSILQPNDLKQNNRTVTP